MAEITKIFIAWTLILISILLLLVFFPTLGLYLLCTSSVVLYRIHTRHERLKKNLISAFIFIIVWLCLLDKTFELQGNYIAGTLCEYSNRNHMPENNYLPDKLYIYSYTPIFTKYKYHTKISNPKEFEDIQLSYLDLWGNLKIYCAADGEFENK